MMNLTGRVMVKKMNDKIREANWQTVVDRMIGAVTLVVCSLIFIVVFTLLLDSVRQCRSDARNAREGLQGLQITAKQTAQLQEHGQ